MGNCPTDFDFELYAYKAKQLIQYKQSVTFAGT
jgi:hypothetical protein